MRTVLLLLALPLLSSCHRAEPTSRPAARRTPGALGSDAGVIVAALPEQSLRLEFPLSDEQSGSKPAFASMLDLEARLEQAIAAARVGELDGNEVGGGTFLVFTYGPDADALFRAVAPTLLASPHSSACTVILRHGPPGTAETRLAFSEAVQRFKVGP